MNYKPPPASALLSGPPHSRQIFTAFLRPHPSILLNEMILGKQTITFPVSRSVAQLVLGLGLGQESRDLVEAHIHSLLEVPGDFNVVPGACEIGLELLAHITSGVSIQRRVDSGVATSRPLDTHALGEELGQTAGDAAREDSVDLGRGRVLDAVGGEDVLDKQGPTTLVTALVVAPDVGPVLSRVPGLLQPARVVSAGKRDAARLVVGDRDHSRIGVLLDPLGDQVDDTVIL